MHGRTFNALKGGESVTIWSDGAWYGRPGRVASKIGVGTKGKGWIIVELINGERTDRLPFHKVANGDNSFSDDKRRHMRRAKRTRR